MWSAEPREGTGKGAKAKQDPPRTPRALTQALQPSPAQPSQQPQQEDRPEFGNRLKGYSLGWLL